MIGKSREESSEIIKSLEFQERMDFLKEHKKALIAQKKSSIKFTDGINTIITNKADTSTKEVDVTSKESIRVKIVGNTSMVMDSHDDVQITGCWKKTLNECQSKFYHTKNHSNFVDDYIGQHVKTYTKSINTNKFNVKTDIKDVEVLIMESNVLKALDEKMFTQYALGMVKQHSVGMVYYKISLALNDPYKDKEYKVYQKHYPNILNKEHVDSLGYYWAVEESGLIEVSAVTRGSNELTPTLEVKQEPSNDTQQIKDNEPIKVTQPKPEMAFNKVFNELKFK